MMMQAVAFIVFISVFGMSQSEGVGSIPGKMCKVISITCPCGENKTNFTVTLDVCSVENISLESEINRFRIRRLCSKFSHCETCSPDVQKCTSCPKGMHGKFCTKSDATREKIRHRVQRRALCSVPTLMDTGTPHCSRKDSTITCLLHCDKDYSYPDGKNRTITCDLKDGIWKPHGFKECNHTKFNVCNKNALEKEGKKGGRNKREDTACSRSNGRRKRESNNLCEVPKSMNFSKIECQQVGKEILCEQTCKSGFQYNDGLTKRIMKCNVLVGLWKPQTFEDCNEKYAWKASLCAIPSHLETNTFKCNESRGLITCHQTCNDGYTFREGPQRTITCKTRLGLWKPHNFQQCTKKYASKRSLCAVPSHMETNTIECHESQSLITCSQTCNEGYTFREGTQRTITCKTNLGLWKPHDFQQCKKY